MRIDLSEDRQRHWLDQLRKIARSPQIRSELEFEHLELIGRALAMNNTMKREWQDLGLEIMENLPVVGFAGWFCHLAMALVPDAKCTSSCPLHQGKDKNKCNFGASGIGNQEIVSLMKKAIGRDRPVQLTFWPE